MSPTDILAALDAEISRLQHARSFIAGTPVPKRRGRPRKTGTPVSALPAAAKKRTFSADGRKRIAEAQRKRWAKQKAKSD